MKSNLTFRDGIKEGLPIGIGYLSASFGFGVMAVGMGIPVIKSVIIAMTNFASAGQVAGINIIAEHGTIFTVILSMFIINMRYALMGLTLTQKLDESFTTPKRLLCSAFIADEVFIMAVTKARISARYFLGLALIPYLSWGLGTLLGAVAGELLPQSVCSALGIAIYGMFIAVIIPPIRKFKGVLIAIAIAATLSCIIRYVPLFSFISGGFSVIICAVAAAVIAALVKPIFEDVAEENQEDKAQ